METNKPGLEQFKKILELELSKGCTDSAVIGGLDKYLKGWYSWQKEPSFVWRSILPEGTYADMNIDQRRRWIDQVFHRLDNSQSDKSNKVSNASRRDKGGKTPSHQKEVHSPLGQQSLSLDSSITSIKGVQSSIASKFGKLGVKTIRDLMYLFPHRYNDFRRTIPIAQAVPGAEQTVRGIIWEVGVRQIGRMGKGTEAIIGDDTGNIRVVWFNNPYMAKTLKAGQRVALSGRVNLFRGNKVFESPDYEILEGDDQIHTGRMVPVYPLTEGVYQRSVRRLVRKTLEIWIHQVKEFLPETIRKENGLMELPRAVWQAHYPDDEHSLEQARRRLAFDELLLMQLRVLGRRREWKEGQQAHLLKRDHEVLRRFLQGLPFELTRAQKRSLEQVLTDVESTVPMSRLLQGEVGSGKTVVATAVLLMAAAHGRQGAIMAPTEILAEQHFRTICKLLGAREEATWGNDAIQVFESYLNRPLRIGLLISDIRGKVKRELQDMIRHGGVDIVIGTHALIQKEVDFKDLALVVVDEQHRFGVMQRLTLRQKGTGPHLLVMTATPIPRTLALTLYGDLELSVIDELPPGRQEIETRKVSPGNRNKAYQFLWDQVRKGRQAFIICPLIEESEVLQVRAATQEFQRLSENVFPDLRLGLLHGRLSASEKDTVMEQFRPGKLDILVSTPVVEVGIDIPNATVMMIEGAERFGLSQLHQFRGRVGRGSEKSYCLLLSENMSREAKERLSLMEQTQDGFKLAEEDLRLRGPGEFFGTRQSGFPDLRMATLTDVPLLELTRKAAERLLEEDPDLRKGEHKPLKEELKRFGANWNVGGAEA